MVAPSNRDAIDRFYKALNDRHFDDVLQLVDGDAIQEWPQSGERFRGRENIGGALMAYPGLPRSDVKRVVGGEDKWVLTPTWTPLRIVGTGDQYTVESLITYPNGEEWHYVGIFEFRDGKIHKLTQFFAPPFPAAEWRSQWAEKMGSDPRKT